MRRLIGRGESPVAGSGGAVDAGLEGCVVLFDGCVSIALEVVGLQRQHPNVNPMSSCFWYSIPAIRTGLPGMLIVAAQWAWPWAEGQMWAEAEQRVLKH